MSQLKEGILLDRCPALLPLKEISGVPIQTNDAQCNARDGFQKVKQIEISIQDNQIHPSEQSSVYQIKVWQDPTLPTKQLCHQGQQAEDN